MFYFNFYIIFNLLGSSQVLSVLETVAEMIKAKSEDDSDVKYLLTLVYIQFLEFNDSCNIFSLVIYEELVSYVVNVIMFQLQLIKSEKVTETGHVSAILYLLSLCIKRWFLSITELSE